MQPAITLPPAARTMWNILAHAVLMQVVVYSLRIITSYQAISLGFPPGWLAVFAMAFIIGPCLISIPIGRMIDRWGEAVSLKGSSLAAVALALLYLLSGQHLWVLMVLTAGLGVAHSIMVVGQQSQISKATAGGGRDLWFGRYTVAVSLGQFLSPGLIAALAWVSPDGLNALTFFVSVLVALAGLVAVLPLRGQGAGRSGTKAGGSLTAGQLMKIPGFTLAMMANVMVVITIDLFIVYMPALGESRGMSAAAVASLLAVRAICSMASRLCVEALLRRWGRKLVLIWGIGLAGASAVVLPFAGSFALTAALMALAGFGLGICLPLTLTWTSNITPDTARGVALSLRQNANRIGQLTLMPVMGGLANVVGMASPFCAAGLALLVVSALIQRQVRDKI